MEVITLGFYFFILNISIINILECISVLVPEHFSKIYAWIENNWITE